MAKTHVTMKVNGAEVEGLVEPRTLLVHFIRENLSLTGTHIGCETTHCGACTVDIDGMSVKSCTMFAVQAQGSDIMTIEGVANADGSKLYVHYSNRNGDTRVDEYAVDAAGTHSQLRSQLRGIANDGHKQRFSNHCRALLIFHHQRTDHRT